MGKIVVSIEARMTSTRLPGKVLRDLCGKPMLQVLIERVRQSKYGQHVLVATTDRSTDEPVQALCEKLSVGCFRGSESDVLQRVLQAHQSVGSDIIVELTGDNPLVDPRFIDECVDFYLANSFDYVTNGIQRTYPDGMGVQVFSTKVLAEAESLTKEKADREHVSRFIYKSGRYSMQILKAPPALTWPELSLTVDTLKDFELVEKVCRHFGNFRFTIEEIVAYFRANPELAKYNL